MNLPKILIAAPTSDKKDYAFEDWAKCVLNMDYANYKVLMVDNSHDETYHHKILDRGIDCLYVKPEGNAVDYITKCQNLIRYYTLKGGYDYLFMLESDVVARTDMIIQLLHHHKPVVTAPYFVQYKGGDPSICMLDAVDQHFDGLSYRHVEMVSTENTLHRMNGRLRQVFACGIGCTMIQREVLEEIEFRSDVNNNEVRMDRSVFSDSLFYVDCAKKDIPVYLDTYLYAHHNYSGWDDNIDLYN
jgi:hypothetical protein